MAKAKEVEPVVQEAYAPPSPWPTKIEKFEDAQKLLTYLWDSARRYSMAELSVLSMAKFELNHKYKIPAHILRQLEKIEKSWVYKDAAHAYATRKSEDEVL